MENNITCPSCGSTYLIEQIHPEQIHYGRLVCGNCRRWLAWIPKPEKVTAQLRRSHFISGLLMDSKLSPWERGFLRDIQNKRWLTAKQKLKFNQISIKIVGATYENTPSRGSGKGKRAMNI